MIKIAILGDIGAGKTFVSKLFGFPVFNADKEVKKIYKSNKKCFNKLKKKFPNKQITYPINKKVLIDIIIEKKQNLKIINEIVHPIVRGRMKSFLKKNKTRNASTRRHLTRRHLRCELSVDGIGTQCGPAAVTTTLMFCQGNRVSPAGGGSRSASPANTFSGMSPGTSSARPGRSGADQDTATSEELFFV